MRWVSEVSDGSDTADAVGQAIERAVAALGSDADLAIVFVTEHHRSAYEEIGAWVKAQLPRARIFGCSASGVIGGGQEIEQQPAISVTLASLPNVRIDLTYLSASTLPATDAGAQAWTRCAGVAPEADPVFVVLADPFSFPSEAFVTALDRYYPRAPKIGGLASGARGRGQAVLYADGAAHRAGALSLALSGDVAVDTYVAQGCRPIGEPMFVTRADGPLLAELDGKPALEVLQSVYEQLDPADQKLAQSSLFIGLAMRSAANEYRQGDFLIRNLMSADAERLALYVGADLHERHVVQFHLRDAKTSAFDLERVLAPLAQGRGGAQAAAGALLFSCTGRGEYLYGRLGHDSDVFRRYAGALPLGGFFCNGEIGPVHATTYVHGYTSAFGLFRPKGT